MSEEIQPKLFIIIFSLLERAHPQDEEQCFKGCCLELFPHLEQRVLLQVTGVQFPR